MISSCARALTDRERERERQRDRDRDRETERDRDREGERERTHNESCQSTILSLFAELIKVPSQKVSVIFYARSFLLSLREHYFPLEILHRRNAILCVEPERGYNRFVQQRYTGRGDACRRH